MSDDEIDQSTTTIRIKQYSKVYLDEFKSVYRAASLEKGILALLAYFYRETSKEWKNIEQNFADDKSMPFTIHDYRTKELEPFLSQLFPNLCLEIDCEFDEERRTLLQQEFAMDESKEKSFFLSVDMSKFPHPAYKRSSDKR